MRLIDAARHLVRRFSGGVAAVAARIPRDNSMGGSAHKGADVLRHELAGTGSNKLGLEDAELITQLAIEQGVADPLAILNAFAAGVGAMVLPLPSMVCRDEMTIAGLAEFAREFSEVVTSMAEAVKDGDVTANELAAVDKELGELVARGQALRAHLAHLHECRKPQGECRADAR